MRIPYWYCEVFSIMSLSDHKCVVTSRPTVFLIGGAWSAGKSTIAVRLANHLRIANVIHTDVLRTCIRASIEGKEAYCVSLATYETWRCQSLMFSPQSLSSGFLRQCKAILPLVRQCLDEAIQYGKDTVIEGLHLHPLLVQEIIKKVSAIYVWLTYPGNMYERKICDRCCTTYRNRPASRYLEMDRAKKILMLNQLLLDVAREQHITILDVTQQDTIETLTKMLVKPI